MRRVLGAVLAVGLLGLPSLPGSARPIQPEAFQLACSTLPFELIKRDRPIDQACRVEGGGSPASRLHSRQKNNFCADGVPARATFTTFRRLQQAVDDLGSSFRWDHPTRLPDDRAPLRDIYTTSDGHTIGEGSVVVFVGYLMHTRYSNTSSGETVNCNLTGQANNDVHIYLAASREQDDRCWSVNAAISPRFRPESREEIVGLSLDRPMRITGRLFFDAAHEPCRGSVRHQPNRISSWETHPGCRWDRESVWIPFDQWVGIDEH